MAVISNLLGTIMVQKAEEDILTLKREKELIKCITEENLARIRIIAGFRVMIEIGTLKKKLKYMILWKIK